VVVDVEAPVSALPFTVDVQLPPNPETLIEPGDPAPDVAMYYFAVAIDLDDDGQLCSGDYGQDYGTEGPTFFNLTNVSALTIDMEVKTGIACSSVP
jgi:hypothetical protein